MTGLRTSGAARIIALSVAGLVLAGCGSTTPTTAGHDHPSATGAHDHPTATTPSGSPASTVSAFNEVDVKFAQMMIPHHEQAVRMSDMIITKSGVDPRVTAMAQQITRAQGPEITTMQGWLTSWGRPTDADMGEMHHGGDDGMLTEAELKALDTADARTGQRLFLDGMIGHHRGAVTMADTELAGGDHPAALALAGAIKKSQQAEISTMQALLVEL